MSTLQPSLPFLSAFELTLEQLAALASERIVRRGLAYARAGRVVQQAESFGRLEGKVRGGRAEPYLVRIEHDGEELLGSCDCPFDWEPLCKHAVALLAARNQLEREEPTAAEGPAGASQPGAEEPGGSAAGVSQPPASPTGADEGGPASGPGGAPRSEAGSPAGAELGREPEDGSGAPPTLEEQEIAVRRQRAEQEGFRIRTLDADGLYGRYLVESPSGRSYWVEIRSLTERLNHCTCPDLSGSMLGTCKHVEAVLAACRERNPAAMARAIARGPSTAQLLVDQRDTPRLRLLLPGRAEPRLAALAAEFFDRDGCFVGDPVQGFAELMARANGLPGLVVHQDAIAWSRQAAAERLAQQRAVEVRQAVLAAGCRIPGVHTRLYPFQVEGAAFLAARGRALLGDDMGLGKTVQAIAALRILWDRGEVRRALVVCPASLKQQWADELERFCGLPTVIVGGPVPERQTRYRAGAAVTIINYELVLRDARAIGELAPELLILDEAQRLRNWRTKTADAVKQLRSRFAFVLSGTPLQNRLDDLYSVMQVVDRRVLGPLWAFNERFVEREPDSGKILGYCNLGELRRRLQPVVLRREKEEVAIQLPARLVSRIGLELTEPQRALMREAMDRAARLAKLAERRPLTRDEEQQLSMAMQRARMACDAAGLVDKQTTGSPKLDEFEQLVSELCLERGRKVVVFSEWERFGALAAERAEKLGLGFVRLHGAVPVAERGALIERFRDDPACQLFFSTDAGGVGLNLQFASTVINLELPWNPAVLEQRIGRVHRHGQTQPVHVVQLVSEDSFETGIERALRGQRSLFGAALAAGSELESIPAPSSCLETVRAALLQLQTGELDATQPLFVGEAEPDAAGEREAGGEREAVAEEVDRASDLDPAALLAALLGSRLRRVLRLPSGRLVAEVDRIDDVTRAAAEQAGVALTDPTALAGLAALGEDSPFARAETLLDRSSPGDGAPAERAGVERLAVARRKLQAAERMACAELAAEAIGQAHAAMTAALRSLMASTPAPAELPTARLLFERLVPAGLLTLEQAAQVARAEGLSRAYGDSLLPVPAALLTTVLSDARALLAAVARRLQAPEPADAP